MSEPGFFLEKSVGELIPIERSEHRDLFNLLVEANSTEEKSVSELIPIERSEPLVLTERSERQYIGIFSNLLAKANSIIFGKSRADRSVSIILIERSEPLELTERK